MLDDRGCVITSFRESFEHTRRALELIPVSAPAAALMRHAERGDFAAGDHGNDVLLTAQGEKDAVLTGELMRGRISRLLHSPVRRCLQTAEGLCEGGHASSPEEWMSLRCDAYLVNFNAACTTLGRLVSEKGFYNIFVAQMSAGGGAPYPHFKPPRTGTRDLLAPLLSESAGICVGITHDWLINVAASHLTGRATKRNEYAGFLDALFLWKENGVTYFYYRGRRGACPADFFTA